MIVCCILKEKLRNSENVDSIVSIVLIGEASIVMFNPFC